MKKYKYLLLDFDNTLVDFVETERRALRNACRDVLGLTITDEERLSYHHINDMYWKALERHEVTKDRLKILRFRDFLRVLYENHPELPEIMPEVLNERYVYYLSSIVVEYPETEQVCKKLAEEYELYIITNGATAVQMGRMAGCSFKDDIRSVIISEQFGCSKPDARFFDGILSITNDPEKSRYLVIGDSPTSDMKFAENVGLDACYVTNGQKYRCERKWLYEIEGIGDLSELLEKTAEA